MTKVYRTGEVEVHALRGVDLELFGGETAVLLGPSGSGKSTLLNILGRLDLPTGALDSKTGILVLEAIDRVNRGLGTTTALITHDAAIAAMADRVIRFADGHVVETRENSAGQCDRGFHRSGDAWTVFVHQGGRAELRQVTLGRQNDLTAEVLAGVAPGEEVVLHPSDRLHDGVGIVVRTTASLH